MPPKRMRSNVKPGKQPPSQQVHTSADPDTSAADANFQRELAWCLDILEAEIKRKTNPKQAEEAAKAWKILSNPKTALVKKRQVMRNHFGDYRAKMEREERMYSIRPQDMRITQISHDGAPSSKYFKSSCCSATKELASTAQDFAFKFSLNDVQPEDPSSSSADTMRQSADKVPVNYYHLVQSKDREFLFDFDVSNQDKSET